MAPYRKTSFVRDEIAGLTALALYFARLGWSVGVAVVRPGSLVRGGRRVV